MGSRTTEHFFMGNEEENESFEATDLHTSYLYMYINRLHSVLKETEKAPK